MKIISTVFCFIFSAIICMSIGSHEALAGTLYAGTGLKDGGRIITINPLTGSGTLIGSSGFNSVGGLAFGSNGILYGATGDAIGPSNLITINLATGVGTSIGPIASSSGAGVKGLAFNSTGTLYATAWNGTSGELWTIDPNTAAMILIGVITGGTGNNFVSGISFSSTGILYGSRGNSSGHVENIDTINPLTAVCTPLGSGSSNVISYVAFDPDSGILYGVTGGIGSVLLTIDPVTGAETVIGPIGFNYVSSLAIVSNKPQSVPTMNEWGMIIFIVLAGLSSVYYLRRQRRA